MALDSSIILGVKPLNLAQPDPIERYVKLAGVQEIQGKLADQERTRADDEAVRDAYRQSGGDSETLRKLLTGRGAYKQIQALDKADYERRQAESTISRNTAQAGKAKWEVEKELAGHGANLLGKANADNWEDIVRAGELAKYWTPEAAQQMRQNGYSPEFVARAQASSLTYQQQLEADNRTATRAQTAATAPFTPGPGGVSVPNQPVQDYERSKLPGGQPHYDATRGIVVTPSTATAAPVTMDGQPLPQKRELGPPQEVNTPSGPRLVVQDKQSGQMLDANTMQPVTGIGPKLGEGAQKQLTGAGVTRDAITTYRDVLKTFNLADALNPQARASMGTVYHNLLLQAKEAFNLGVLNGQDYEILQKVITDPTSAKGTFLTKDTLDKQAKTLDGILDRVEKKINQIQSGVTPTSSMQVTPDQQSGRDNEAAAIRAREPVQKIQADIASLEDALKNTRLNGDQRRILSAELILQKKALALKGAGPAPVVAPTAPPGTGTTGGGAAGWSIRPVP